MTYPHLPPPPVRRPAMGVEGPLINVSAPRRAPAFGAAVETRHYIHEPFWTGFKLTFGALCAFMVAIPVFIFAAIIGSAVLIGVLQGMVEGQP